MGVVFSTYILVTIFNDTVSNLIALLISYSLAICGDLDNITNGVITYSPTSSPRREDTVAAYSCSMGLELFDAETRTCQNDRTWSGMDAYCQR